MTEIVLRDALESDMLDVERIYARYVSHAYNGHHVTFDEEAPSAEEHALRYRDIVDRGLPYLVAELDGEIVGYSYAARYRERSAYRFTVQESVYVRDGMSGRGIGKRLLLELIARCEARGLRQMIALIVDGNAPSIAMHERLGFEIVGRLRDVGFKQGQTLSTLLLQRSLVA